VRTSRRLDLLHSEIQEIINRYPLGATAYNIAFDFSFLKNRRFVFPRKLDCPMLLSTDVCRIPNSYRKGSFKWPKVEEAYAYFFPTEHYVEKHRGADDAIHEAKIVFEFGVPILAVGWDACLDEALLDSDDIKKIRNGSELGKFAMDCNRQLMELNRERFGYDVLDLADPSAISAILYPESIKECDDDYCEVDTSSSLSYGSVLVYDKFASTNKPNAAICSKLHGDKFKQYMYKTLCQSQKED